ncbi:MAG TPA: penicillin acylase family protein [Bacteriovoracaceae bacterium]|nr:penicillin acylase family protein [Bacteriovoracaceae bacterium]
MLLLFFILWSSISFAQTPADCKASYDTLDIPHLTVSSQDSLYYCFGYHHGQDRAWQMDYFRRVGQGRNAEVLGYQHVKSDLMMRLLDLPGEARRIWLEFEGEKKRHLTWYAAGANEGFKTGKDQIEFRDGGYRPEPWKPEDTLLILLLQSFDQNKRNFLSDFEEEKFKQAWGARAERLFSVEGLPWNNTILKSGEYETRPGTVKSSSSGSEHPKLWSGFPSLFGAHAGSNNWAVSAKKSKNGYAVLANDPHLDLKTPIFWYWMSLKSPAGNVTGGSLPGVPIIANGTNGDVSWGLTNSYINTADVVALTDLKPEMIETFRPWVTVKVGFLKLPFFFKSFQRLKSGHRILPLETEIQHPIALKWSGFGLRARDIYPIFELYTVRSVSEMDVTLKKIEIPSWNYVFADTQGDIGFRLVGRSYRHTQATPFGIPQKSFADFSRDDFLSPEERPQLLRPKREYVHTSNNRHWPLDSRNYGGRGYWPSFRAFRVDQLLSGPQDAEGFKHIQCDGLAPDAQFFVPRIQKQIEIPELAGWTGETSDGSRSAGVYRRLMDLMLEGWKVNEYALYRLLEKLTLKQTAELRGFLKTAREDTRGRSWSDVLRINFPHMSKNEDWAFANEMAGKGDTHSVNPGSSKWNAGKHVYQQFSGASMRMIIEMSKPPRIQLILPGHNRNYAEKKNYSPWVSWRNCDYRDVKF